MVNHDMCATTSVARLTETGTEFVYLKAESGGACGDSRPDYGSHDHQ